MAAVELLEWKESFQVIICQEYCWIVAWIEGATVVALHVVSAAKKITLHENDIFERKNYILFMKEKDTRGCSCVMLVDYKSHDALRESLI